MKTILFVALLFRALISFGQAVDTRINPELLNKFWSAHWISSPKGNFNSYGVYHFRKKIMFEKKPKHFIVHISADNRYKLYVNDTQVSVGPALGNLKQWYYETVDIAPYLKEGDNILASVVWNYAEYAGPAQVSEQTAFIVQGNTDVERVVNTNSSWKIFKNPSYSPLPYDRTRAGLHISVGPGERIEGSQYPWGWTSLNFDDSQWQPANEIGRASPRGIQEWIMPWMLVPRDIPPMVEEMVRIPKIARSYGTVISTDFLKGKGDLVILPKTKAVILLDQTFLTNAYPEFRISKGKNSELTILYAEALYDSTGNRRGEKGNRNEIKGKQILGYYDRILPDGEPNRIYRSLWFRTYRYIQFEITTNENPLIIHDFYGIATGYPFQEKGAFASNDQSLKKIWDVSLRTAKLCAHETYFDCPYYEQQQYAGDTRIQAMISLYTFGDDRLVRKAIKQFSESTSAEGLTESRQPSSSVQYIPTFSLFWTGMVHDYWMHRSDSVFVSSLLRNIDGVLSWHEQYIDNSGMLGRMPWWQFVDWAKEWPWKKDVGGQPAGSDGNSAILTLQYVYALQNAAALFDAFNKKEQAAHYRQLAATLKKATLSKCWDEKRGLVAETPEKNQFSQHANIMAVLTDLVPKENQKSLVEKILTEQDLIQCTFYYRYYLTRAMTKAGLGDRYLEQLTPWHEMLQMGLTTFAENPEPTRSDCHAWSASPAYEFLATVCGIMPSSPGFKSVRIEPQLGSLQWAEGKVPHPQGEITVKLKREGKDKITGVVTLPPTVTGQFIWRGKVIELKGGNQKISL